MSDEAKTEEVHQMYVQQIDWDTFKSLIERVTNANRLYMYNMPNKAESYIGDIVNLIQTLDTYLTSDDSWRVSDEKNIPFRLDKKNDKIIAGNWLLNEPKLILCIPKLNSFFIVPDKDAKYKDGTSPTTILQLSNCISVMPMLLTMREIPDTEKEGVINVAMAYEMLNPQTNE